jgi:hypothetical protein
MRRIQMHLALLTIGVGLLAACGPVQTTSFLIDASNALEAARSAGAERLAPYEWTSATLYFAKAKEESGRSEYEQAVDYSKKALELATKARAQSQRAAARLDAESQEATSSPTSTPAVP